MKRIFTSTLLLGALMLLATPVWAVTPNGKCLSPNKSEESGQWIDIMLNGDLTNNDSRCYYFKRYPETEAIHPAFGITSRGAFYINFPAKVNDERESQIYIRLPQRLSAGTPFKISFDYKATYPACVSTESNAEPGFFLHSDAIGDVQFTESWQTFEKTVTVFEECGEDFRTIAFNVAKEISNMFSNMYYMKNIKVEIPIDAVRRFDFPNDEQEEYHAAFSSSQCPFTDDSRITSGSEFIEGLSVYGPYVWGWTCANNAQNGYAFSHFDFSRNLVNLPNTVELKFNYYNTKGGRSFLTIGDASVRGTTGGSTRTTYNGSGAIFRIGSDKSKFYICDREYSQDDLCDKWMRVTVSADLDEKKVSWIVSVMDEETNTYSFLESHYTDFYSMDAKACTQIDVFGYVNNSHCCMMSDLDINSMGGGGGYDYYLVKYVDADYNELKPARLGGGWLQHELEFLPSDKEAIYSQDGMKYIFNYSSEDYLHYPDMESDEPFVVWLYFREAETYYASLSCHTRSGLKPLANLTGTFFEGDKLTLYPAHGYGYDGKYYFTTPTSYNCKSFTFPGSIEPSVRGGKTYYLYTLLYPEDESVAYYSDFERLALPVEGNIFGTGLGQLEGTVTDWNSTVMPDGTYFDRFSQGLSITLSAGSYVWTEPIAEAATYQVSVYGRNDSGSIDAENPYALGYRTADGEVYIYSALTIPTWKAAVTGNSVVEGVAIPAGASLVVANPDASNKMSLDDITLVKTGDFAEPIADGIGLTPAISKGAEEIYNLVGQRMNKMQRGINIVGGKKILVK